MVGVTDARIRAAEARGRRILKSEPRALAAHFDRATGHVTIDLVNGCSYMFPAALVQDLQGAGNDDLAGIVVDGAGLNLHWPALDADLYVPALLSGMFGTREWMTREPAHAAQPAKPAAAQSNDRRSRKAGGG